MNIFLVIKEKLNFGGHLGFWGQKPNVRYTLNLANIYSCLGNMIRFLKSITNLAPPGGATGVIMGFWNITFK